MLYWLVVLTILKNLRPFMAREQQQPSQLSARPAPGFGQSTVPAGSGSDLVIG